MSDFPPSDSGDDVTDLRVAIAWWKERAIKAEAEVERLKEHSRLRGLDIVHLGVMLKGSKDETARLKAENLLLHQLNDTLTILSQRVTP